MPAFIIKKTIKKVTNKITKSWATVLGVNNLN
jgi:hypothetical protein